MKKKYRLKKRHSISALTVIIVAIVTVIIMNVGYSLWSSKLNIYGKVTLDFEPPPIEVVVPARENNIYTEHTGFSTSLRFNIFGFCFRCVH